MRRANQIPSVHQLPAGFPPQQYQPQRAPFPSSHQVSQYQPLPADSPDDLAQEIFARLATGYLDRLNSDEDPSSEDLAILADAARTAAAAYFQTGSQPNG